MSKAPTPPELTPEQRLAEALRANLYKRKARAREEKSGNGTEGNSPKT